MKPIDAASAFAKNRAEELGYDVWEHFVLPPFYDRMDIEEARKPRVFIAGRGCGKTMLLRYLCHQSTFSTKRAAIPPESLRHVGLYWRVDTQFANAMAKRDVSDETWQAAFHHLLALVFGIELLNSLQSIASSSIGAFGDDKLNALNCSGLQAFDPTFTTEFHSLLADLVQRMRQLQGWVNNVGKLPEPVFLPGKHFLVALIQIIKEQLPPMKAAVFFVYLDEYENLRPPQKDIIHTCLKHSDYGESLVFNLAVKRNALGVPHTLGPESISHIHDWRYIDLEWHFLEGDFPLFAAEILLMHLSMAGVAGLPICVEDLRRREALNSRRTPDYRERVLKAVHDRFPDVSEDDLARSVFEDNSLSTILRERINKALSGRNSKIEAVSFIRPHIPKASIVAPALLNRTSISIKEVATEMDSLEQVAPNKFTGTADWIHNNFIGCLLQLYEPYDRPCPFYAGFSTFCKLAHGNIRHLLELCHKSVQLAARESPAVDLRLNPTQEAIAAKLASAAFLGEIRSFGPKGNQLHTFVLRLGSLFALAHERPTQSEPEVSHFAINRGTEPLADEDVEFLREAIKWSVVFDEASTKDKNPNEPESIEYVLNPIYSPYFHITYRKRRRLDLSSDEAIVLMRGNYTEYKSLVSRKSRAWGVELSDRPNLFSHIEEETDN